MPRAAAKKISNSEIETSLKYPRNCADIMEPTIAMEYMNIIKEEIIYALWPVPKISNLLSNRKKTVKAM